MDVALVTGGNSGIGYEVVRQLAKEGMVVYLGSRDAEKGIIAAAELSSAGDVRPIHLDLADEATLRSAVERIDREQGRLDLLVNNAGVALPGDRPETIAIVFQANLHGPVQLAQLCVPLLRRSAAGRIVNVSSGAGRFSFMAGDFFKMDPEKLHYAYPVSKTALNAATVLLAKALEREGIRVNAVCPGMVATRLSGMRGKSPTEGAAIIVSVAKLSVNGPTGGFFDGTGPIDW
ncbi:short-chain dehydrogenase [Kaistia sp. 32K]|uniref:SDR family NAD(P)-dependent oxidoreductase n=1 Tax=Kaistia sp. 32K TaxID=2795690 RepID=UPI001916A263|nr:SDR family NAD(P)-dependent oxidoreductase [Kaistia sp. 32K]BCP54021.1 short-chain dehydrogenase [Kaistia sp. 32K]